MTTDHPLPNLPPPHPPNTVWRADGAIHEYRRLADGNWYWVKVADRCEVCGGSGDHISHPAHGAWCPACGGSGRVPFADPIVAEVVKRTEFPPPWRAWYEH